MFEEGPREPRREIVRGILVVKDGVVGGWRVYGGGGTDDEVVLERREWWRKDDGKRFGRRWIRLESMAPSSSVGQISCCFLLLVDVLGR